MLPLHAPGALVVHAMRCHAPMPCHALAAKAPTAARWTQLTINNKMSPWFLALGVRAPALLSRAASAVPTRVQSHSPCTRPIKRLASAAQRGAANTVCLQDVLPAARLGRRLRRMVQCSAKHLQCPSRWCNNPWEFQATTR